VAVFNEHFEPNDLGKALNAAGVAAPPQDQRVNVQAVVTTTSAGKRVAQVATDE
jgi:hypothetical protein